MPAMTSASHACGSTPLSLAVSISVAMAAARSAPRSEPAGLATEGKASQRPLSRVTGQADPAIIEEGSEAIPALQHVVDRLGHLADLESVLRWAWSQVARSSTCGFAAFGLHQKSVEPR